MGVSRQRELAVTPNLLFPSAVQHVTAWPRRQRLDPTTAGSCRPTRSVAEEVDWARTNWPLARMATTMTSLTMKLSSCPTAKQRESVLDRLACQLCHPASHWFACRVVVRDTLDAVASRWRWARRLSAGTSQTQDSTWTRHPESTATRTGSMPPVSMLQQRSGSRCCTLPWLDDPDLGNWC